MRKNPVKILDLNNPPKGFELQLSIDDKWHEKEKIYHIFTNDNLIIFYRQQQHRLRPEKTSRQQHVAPKSSLKWFHESIESIYTPNQNSSMLSIKTDINAESILLNRAVSIGGEGIPGFILSNLSRTQYGWNDEDGITQELAFPDDFLKNSSFLNDLKNLNI